MLDIVSDATNAADSGGEGVALARLLLAFAPGLGRVLALIAAQPCELARVPQRVELPPSF